MKSILLSLLFSSATLSCQSQRMDMYWQIAGKIPATEDNFQKIGIAGPVTGMLDNNTFLLGGGANFPEKKTLAGRREKILQKRFCIGCKGFDSAIHR